MSRTTNHQGFTLLELLIGMAIFGALSLVSVQMLWDTLSARSKQYSIENSTSSVRPILATLEQAIASASTSSIISATEIQITGTTCRTIKLNGSKIVQEVAVTSPCAAPTISVSSPSLTPENFNVTTFLLAPSPYPNTNPNIVTITIGGTYSDGLGSHTFYATTSAAPRVSL